MARHRHALTIVSGVLLFAVQCSHPTELVVVVDTDLVPGAEVDDIRVHVAGPNGAPPDKEAKIGSAASLPLTLGVAAGATDDAEVTIVATALLRSTPVARTEVVARMVPNESRLVQVSICKACGLTCGRDLGSSLPSWNDVLPPTNACTTTFADAGAFDSGTPIDEDGGSPAEAGDGAVDAGPCGVTCPSGTSCDDVSKACHVQTATDCANTITIAQPMTITGSVCDDAGTIDIGTCFDAGALPSHVFLMGGSSWKVSVKTVGRDVVFRELSASTCNGTSGCNHVIQGGGSVTDPLVSAGLKLAVGAYGGTGCADYTMTVQSQ